MQFPDWLWAQALFATAFFIVEVAIAEYYLRRGKKQWQVEIPAQTAVIIDEIIKQAPGKVADAIRGDIGVDLSPIEKVIQEKIDYLGSQVMGKIGGMIGGGTQAAIGEIREGLLSNMDPNMARLVESGIGKKGLNDLVKGLATLQGMGVNLGFLQGQGTEEAALPSAAGDLHSWKRLR